MLLLSSLLSRRLSAHLLCVCAATAYQTPRLLSSLTRRWVVAASPPAKELLRTAPSLHRAVSIALQRAVVRQTSAAAGRMGFRRARGLCSLLFVLLFCALVEAGKDYYRILQISKGADDATIKKAYKRMALCVTILLVR